VKFTFQSNAEIGVGMKGSSQTLGGRSILSTSHF